MDKLKQQIQKFRDAARELECNDSERSFDNALRKVAKAKITDGSKKPSQSRTKNDERKI
jgi:hypothetical protein